MSDRHRQALLAFLIGMVLGGLWSAAYGQAIPYGQHDPEAPGHFYSVQCCSLRDCERLDIDAVEEVRDGWRVRYVSERHGLIDELIRHGSSVVRDSQDGSFHGCWRADRNAKPRTICFYVPVNV